MKMSFEHHGTTYACKTRDARSIAIQLDFEGPQPNHFGTEHATDEVLEIDGFVGDTKRGGSCNVKSLSMIPHCNGTHTETVSHIVNEDIWVGHAAMDAMSVAMLITVSSVAGDSDAGTYRPELDPSDHVITAASIKSAIAGVGDPETVRPVGLVIRTKPNTPEKRARAYGEKNRPPFLTVEAMEEVNRLKIRHLLVDFPSVDRMYDDGLLTNHHLFWNVPEGTHELSSDTHQDKTITEMVFVDDELEDGIYLLNLQVPAFCSDAAPSRPVVFPVQVV